MGKRGPNKTPTAILKLHGSWRAKERKDYDGQPSELPDRMPTRLHGNKYAKAFWKKNLQFLHDLGMMTRSDHAAFEEICMVYSEMREAEDVIKAVGAQVCYSRSRGKRVILEEVAVRNKARSEYVRLLMQFGMTPVARAGMDIEIKDRRPKTGKDKFFQKSGSDRA
jgi:P27 family predicted phage terminase small subunit